MTWTEGSQIDFYDEPAAVGKAVEAYHYLESSVWMVAGHYRIALTRRDAGWKIAGIRLDVFYQEGGPDLLSRAQERALAFPRLSGRGARRER